MNAYLNIARPDHWFKNVFMLPGAALALVIFPGRYEHLLFQLLLGLMSTCLVASANYVINEYLDAEFDRFHPTKKYRPSVAGLIKPVYAIIEYFFLVTLGLGIAWAIGQWFLFFSILLLIMGILYNVSPIRLKDRVFIDVLSESFNNPFFPRVAYRGKNLPAPFQYFTSLLVRRCVSHGGQTLCRI
jgi:decaprenyl-phosphate phosphoribosyltransferase